jgi:putative flippase GtrA
MTRPEVVRTCRFIAVNGVGTVLDVGSVFVLTRIVGAPLLLAVFTGWSSSMVAGFLLNRRFVFSDGRATLFTASRRYLALVGFNLLIGVGLVTLLVAHGWNYVLTRLLSSMVLVAINFAVARWWVFVVRPTNDEAESEAFRGLAQLPELDPIDHTSAEAPRRPSGHER